MTTAYHRLLQRTGAILLVAGALALAYAAYVVMEAREYQTTQHRQLEQDREVAPVVRPIADGDVIGEIEIPRLGMSVSVLQGDSPTILRHAVGHLADTPLPGQRGNVVLAGHRDTFFRPLKGARVGDAITMKTRVADVTYLVESTGVVQPGDVRVLARTDTNTLTLITCFPFSYLGSAPDRFIVRARETGNAATPSAGRVH